jgi:4-amino-4-deoxy-L-arabinose transferase-like glycosyltransferase
MSDRAPECPKILDWPVAVLTLLSIPIIFYHLGSYSLVNGDEGLYQYVARHMVESGEWFRLEFTGERRVYDTFMNAPIHYWAKAALIAAFGDNYWTMRILSAVFGLLSVLMTYRLTGYVANRWAAFVAGLLQLTTVQFIYLHGARTGEMETTITFLITLAAYLLLRALEQGRSFVPHFICLGVLTNLKLPLVIVPLAADFLFLALTPVARSRLSGWALTGLVILPLGLAWHIGQALAIGDQFWQVMGTMARQASAASGFGAQTTLGIIIGNALFYGRVVLFGAFPMAAAYPFAIIGMLASKENPPQRRALRLLLLYAATVVTYFVIVAQRYPWYIIPMYPFLSVVLAIWLERLRRATPNTSVVLAASVVLALLLWLHVEIRSFNPFAVVAREIQGGTSWRELLPAPLWLGFPISVLVLAGLLHSAMLLWRARSARAIAYSLVVILIGLAGVRTLYPLEYTEHQGELARLRVKINEAEAAGEALDYPIPVPEFAPLKVRYYFGDDFDIRVMRHDGKLSFFLYPKDGPRPASS